MAQYNVKTQVTEHMPGLSISNPASGVKLIPDLEPSVIMTRQVFESLAEEYNIDTSAEYHFPENDILAPEFILWGTVPPIAGLTDTISRAERQICFDELDAQLPKYIKDLRGRFRNLVT